MNKFQEILTQYNVPHAGGGEHRSVRGGYIGFDCPFCCTIKGEFYAGFNIGGGFINCWRCGYHSVVATLAALTDLPSGECYRIWKDELQGTEAPERRPLGKLVLPPLISENEMEAAHAHYLSNRGFDDRQIQQIERMWGVRSISLCPKREFAWRLFIPIHRYGRVVSWATRAIGDEALPRYRAATPDAEIEHHKLLLYGSDYARHSIVVVEGPLDAWAVGPGAVATLGLSVTTSQVHELGKYVKRSILFDAEPKAQERATELADRLSIFPGDTQIIHIETGKDPAEADHAEIAQIRRTCLT